MPISSAATACAGIVIGVISLTGVGDEFSAFVIGLAQNNLILALILTAMAGIILGMGLPTTPAYIVQVALLVPALVKLGVQLAAAHAVAVGIVDDFELYPTGNFSSSDWTVVDSVTAARTASATSTCRSSRASRSTRGCRRSSASRR